MIEFNNKILSPGSSEETNYDRIGSLPEGWRDDEIPMLPEGYGYKGGVARAALINLLMGYDTPIRDLDIVSIDMLNPDISLANSIAEKYMPRDYAYGDGVEAVENILEYFSTRDFSINEALFVNGQVYATQSAIQAVEEKTIKGSEYELDLFEGRLGPKLALKAILLQVVLEDVTDFEWDIQDIKDTYVTDFYLALALNKAMMLGENIANRFIYKLRNLGFIDYRTTTSQLLSSLEEIFSFDYDDWPDYFDIDRTDFEPYYDYELEQDIKYSGAKEGHMQ